MDGLPANIRTRDAESERKESEKKESEKKKELGKGPTQTVGIPLALRNPVQVCSFLCCSLRQALYAVASSWILTAVMIGWVLLSRITASDTSTWGYLRKLPLIGIPFDFAWRVMVFLEAQYKLSFVYSWLPGALKDVWAFAPSWKTMVQWAHTARALAAR